MIAKLKAFRLNDDTTKSNQITSSIYQLSFSKSAIWSVDELNRAKNLSSNRVLSHHNRFKTKFNYHSDNLSNFTGKSNRLFTNDDLNMLCPVSLHQKLIFDKYDVDCKCKKQIVPLISDIEFDYFLRLVPSEQMIVIAIVNTE